MTRHSSIFVDALFRATLEHPGLHRARPNSCFETIPIFSVFVELAWNCSWPCVLWQQLCLRAKRTPRSRILLRTVTVEGSGFVRLLVLLPNQLFPCNPISPNLLGLGENYYVCWTSKILYGMSHMIHEEHAFTNPFQILM